MLLASVQVVMSFFFRVWDCWVYVFLATSNYFGGLGELDKAHYTANFCVNGVAYADRSPWKPQDWY